MDAMSVRLLQELKRRKLDSSDRIDRTLAALPFRDFPNLVAQLSSALPSITQDVGESPFSFAPNSSIGAQYSSCPATACRIQRAENLGRFAALWADRVYLPFFLSRFQHLEQADSTAAGEMAARLDLANDLKVIVTLAPLLEAGIVRFFESFSYCESCFQLVVREKLETAKRLARARATVQDQMAEFQAELVLLTTDGLTPSALMLTLQGPEDLLPHGGRTFFQNGADLPSWLPATLKRRLLAGGPVTYSIPPSKVKHVREIGDAIDDVIVDITAHRMLSRHVSASFLTDRSVDKVFLDALELDRERSAFNSVLTKYLSFQAPIIEAVPLTTILELRASEDEAYLVYRDTIARLIRQYIQPRTKLTGTEARDLCSDEVLPSLNKLNSRMASVQRALSEKFVRDIAITGTTLTIGVAGTMSHVLPGERARR
jgi:hypothetical protein